MGDVVSGREPGGPTVAVVGLGAMGAPVVRHLRAAGVTVRVHDLDGDALARAGALGAVVCACARDAAAGAAVVTVFVPSDDDVRDVCLGAEGLFAGCEGGAVVLLCSSMRPDTCEALADAAPAGVDVLDAALTGGVRGAEAGQVNLLVGGEADVLDRVRPLLEPWTRAVHLLGPLGAGQIGKTSNNLVHWAQIAAITEALELARRAGLDVPTLRRALMDSSTDSRTLRELEQMRLTWHVKDLANTATLAGRVDMEVPMAEAARQVMLRTTVDGVARLLAGTADEDSPSSGGSTAPRDVTVV